MPYAEPFETIRRKARYGHRDIVVWRDKAGNVKWQAKSADSLKAALLAAGTQGSFTYYAANTGHPHKVRWWMGLNMWRQARLGWQ